MKEHSQHQPVPEEKKEKVITIDDLLYLSGKLYKQMIEFSNSKHPLEIRRGVMAMPDDSESRIIKGAGRTFFMDVEKTRDGNPYLKISESRIDGKTKEQVRNTIFIFEDDLMPFSKAVSHFAHQIKNQKTP